ncbi:MAG: hypothetical protein JXR48_03635 [Candidatus Delongbacteria bacterium]|nr:hypothetical protein [Candidatus Delongbacteria bacterium]MBN2834038.1 hypothetical protein [Candidatus Delongbacteria bacterium]
MGKISDGIKSISFGKAFSGYDKTEVNIFIETLTRSVEELESAYEKVKSERDLLLEQRGRFEREKEEQNRKIAESWKELEKKRESISKNLDLKRNEYEIKKMEEEKNLSQKLNSKRTDLKRLKTIEQKMLDVMTKFVNDQRDVIDLFRRDINKNDF